MKPCNAKFKPLVSYLDSLPSDLRSAIDFSRALEDTAHSVVQPWKVMPLDDPSTPPTPEQCAGAKAIAIGESGPWMRAWVCAHLHLPPIARMVDPARWGTWQVQFDSDGLGDVFADGRLVREKLFLHGVADTVPAREGHMPWIAYSLDTTIQNVLLEMARCRLSGLEEINAKVRDVARSLRTAASLLLTDNPRVNRFLSGEVNLNRSPLSTDERGQLEAQLLTAAAQVDVKAFTRGDLRQFIDSLDRCLDKLAPLADFAHRFHLFLFGVSHMDMAWKWRWPETVECMRGTLANQVELMKTHRDFTFLESSPPVWYALKKRDPALFRDLVAFGRKKQFEAAGGMWVEPDGQMLGAESWVRQTLFGQRASREVLGAQAPSGHNTDAFGFTWAMPKICAHAEMEAFLTQKLRYNEFTVFEEVLFWWEADDGTRILCIHTYPDHYQEIDPDEMAEAVRIFHVTSGVYSAALLFGIGNHGGGPLPDMLERIEDAKRQTVYPQVHMAGMHTYLDHVKTQEADALRRLPVIRDELFLECHHKTYTVQARVKAANRETERGLYHAEAMAVLSGLDARKRLRPAWEIALFNQFHDILPGTSFPMVYQDVFEDYARAGQIIEDTKTRAWKRLVRGGQQSIFALNTLPWRRRGVVCFDGKRLPETGVLADDAGGRIVYQSTGNGDERVCVVPELPALGLRQLTPAADPPPPVDDFTSGPTWVQNRFFRAEFDPKTGTASSVRLADGTEMAGAGGIGRLDMLEDTPTGYYQTWNMHLTGREDPAVCDAFECVESGPVRARFRARLSFGRWEKKKDFMVPIMWNTPGVDYPTSFFIVDYIVYRDLPYIECVMQADWWEDHTDLKVAAPTSLQGTRAFYAIPFGQIERPTRRETPAERARYEVPANNWADLTDGRHGLAILNTGRHGHDALGGRIRLTLLTSPYGGEKVHVPDPLADRGRHTIRYAFYPHAGGPADGNVARVAAEYEYEPQVMRSAGAHVLVGEDMLRIDPDQVLTAAVKPSEDGKALILRCYEPKGREVPLEIGGALSRGPRQAVNFLEHDAGPAPRTLRAHQIASVRIGRQQE